MHVHSVVAPQTCPRLPKVSWCRQQAEAQLSLQGSKPTPEEVELGALQLFENAVLQTQAGSTVPPQSKATFDRQRSLAATSAYTASLAAAAGLTGPLNATVLHHLADFSAPLIWPSGCEGYPLIPFGKPDHIDRVATQLAPRFSVEVEGCDVLVTGPVAPEQRTLVAETLQELQGKVGTWAFAQLQRVHFRSYLGWMGPNSKAGGMADPNLTRAIFLDVDLLKNRDNLRNTLFHEFGHTKDRSESDGTQTYASQTSGSPFGQGGPHDYVSEYARTLTYEDLAETHSYLLRHWDSLKQDPQLWIHANGGLGKKLRWILRTFYDQPVPPPTPPLKQALRQVRSGQSPFADGDEFQQRLQTFLLSQGEPLPANQLAYLQELQSATRSHRPGWWDHLTGFFHR